MITLYSGNPQRFCDRVSRRSFLQVGGLAVGGLTLADWFRAKAVGAEGSEKPTRPTGKSVIMVYLGGGPSQIDMYDMKPNAPVEYRGEFNPIHTNVPGLEICELLPLQTKIADKFSVVRSIQWIEPDHQRAELCSGYPRKSNHPGFGAFVSRCYAGGDPTLPRFVSLSGEDGELREAEDPRWVGMKHRAFVPRGEGVRNLSVADGITLDRLSGRRTLLGEVDRLRRDLDSSGGLEGLDTYTNQALEMISSKKVRDAFDISREPKEVLERYGSKLSRFTYYTPNDSYWDFELFVRARRLVEAGVPYVSLQVGPWDHHGGDGVLQIFSDYRTELPLYDRSISALITDLAERGLDKQVAVCVWGEFGRTPRVNKIGGRDHWPAAGFCLFAGGGLQMGQVIGATDSRAESIKSRAYGPQNVLATLYHVLGIDPSIKLPDHNGRPRYLLEERDVIADLV